MATFREALEMAAQLIEHADTGLLGAAYLKGLASRVREIDEPDGCSGVAVIAGLDAQFERFKEEYPDGPRNHWSAARRSFEKAVKRHGFDVVLDGTIAFAQSGKERQFIEAPAVFLNQGRYLTKYDRGAVNRKGSAGLFALSAALRQ